MFVACDESGKNSSDTYFVIGSIWVSKKDAVLFEQKIAELRIAKKCWGEVCWKKIQDATSPDLLSFYEEFVSLGVKKLDISFRFILANKNIVDLKQYHQGKQEKMHLKFMRLMVGKYGERFLDSKARRELHIVYDRFDESNQSKQEKWRKEMRSWIEYDFGCTIGHIQPCTSHICSLVQLADLFAGAMSTAWNVSPSHISKAKAQMMTHMEQATGRELRTTSKPTEKYFNVWLWRPPVSGGVN